MDIKKGTEMKIYKLQLRINPIQYKRYDLKKIILDLVAYFKIHQSAILQIDHIKIGKKYRMLMLYILIPRNIQETVIADLQRHPKILNVILKKYRLI